MSGSKWRYTPEKCDGDFCPGECDNCPKCWEDAEEEDEGKTCREQLIEQLHSWEMQAIARRDYEYACIVGNLQDLLKEGKDGNDTARSESAL